MALVNSGTAASYNFQDLALNSNNPRVQTTAFYMIQAGSFFTYLPIVDKKMLRTTITRITGNLPKPTWMPVNNGANVQAGPDPEWQDEALFLFRDAFDVDHLLVEDESQINDPFDLRIQSYLKGLSYDLNYKFIQNRRVGDPTQDPRADPNCFDGIRERLDRPDQYGNMSQCKMQATNINLSSSGTGADGINLEFYMDRLMDRMGSPDGQGLVFLMNSLTSNSLDRAVKRAGTGAGFRYDQDAFDRTVTMYKNAVVMTAGYQAPSGPRGQRTQQPIISNTETQDGSLDTGGTYTSIYAIRPGTDHLFGWQFYPTAPTKPRLLDDGTTLRVNIDGQMGLQNPDPYAIGRLFGIQVDSAA